MMGRDEKDRIRVAAEVVTEDVVRANGVAEVAGDLFWGSVINKIGSEGLVDALFGTTGLKEEAAAFA
jgi:hypothetical protein